MASLVELAYALDDGISKSDWKNISERQREARNARRAKRQGQGNMALGGSAAVLGAVSGGVPVLAAMNQGRQIARAEGLPVKEQARFARSLARPIPMRNKVGAGLIAGGAALGAAGAAQSIWGSARERNAEASIRRQRKARSRSV